MLWGSAARQLTAPGPSWRRTGGVIPNSARLKFGQPQTQGGIKRLAFVSEGPRLRSFANCAIQGFIPLCAHFRIRLRIEPPS
jgi:hypothetical protein